MIAAESHGTLPFTKAAAVGPAATFRPNLPDRAVGCGHVAGDPDRTQKGPGDAQPRPTQSRRRLACSRSQPPAPAETIRLVLIARLPSAHADPRFLQASRPM